MLSGGVHMNHLEWITKQMNEGKTWDELKNISEDELVELRDYRGIIPLSIKKLDDWKIWCISSSADIC